MTQKPTPENAPKDASEALSEAALDDVVGGGMTCDSSCDVPSPQAKFVATVDGHAVHVPIGHPHPKPV